MERFFRWWCDHKCDNIAIAILIVFIELSCCSFRLLQDHSASTGVHSHALDTLKAKLEEAENKLKSEQESQKKLEVCHHYKNTALTLQRLAIRGEVCFLIWTLFNLVCVALKGMVLRCFGLLLIILV